MLREVAGCLSCERITRLFQKDDSSPKGLCNCEGSVVDTHFAEYIDDVELDGSLSDEQLVGNFLVAHPPGDQLKDFQLPGRKF